MEARLKKAVRKAFKQFLKDIENEPTLVIESNAVRLACQERR
jgi:hypothetical protein